MKLHPDIPAVIQLADEQLRAYNRGDLDAFCACFADDVVVLDESGRATMRGMQEFRARYGALFAGGKLKDVRADIRGRVSVANHLVELETARRTDVETGQTSVSELIVRYTERDGRIAIVEFLR
ncbi:MAG: nuclear transport factor 2 family protein [Planctomycetota bacterium]